MHKFYDEIDALILLSYHEGSPRVVSEFILSGKPLFLYNHPGLDYIHDLNGVHIYEYGKWKNCLHDIKQNNYDLIHERKNI